MIKFTIVENGSIFTNNYKPFVKNNEIVFAANEEIAVIYGPNGTGKTSLIKVLADHKGTKVEYEFDGKTYTRGKDVFHIINDQNNRNIIEGETKDFFLGDNIRQEHELQVLIAEERKILIDGIITYLKSHGISASNSPLIDLITNAEIAAIIKDIANMQSKGKNISDEHLIAGLETIVETDLREIDDKRLQFLQDDISGKENIIKKIEEISSKPLTSNPYVHQIEENTEAINILNRFHKDQCIVCDTEGIDWEALLSSKTTNRTTVIGTLSDDVKSLIEKIITLVPEADPFEIKTHLVDAISDGNIADIVALLEETTVYKALYSATVLNGLLTIFTASEFSNQVAEYQTRINEKPEITQEDELFIKEIINSSMSQSLTLERDENKNLKILLSNKEILGKERKDLPLSTGEQNFLSLTFEFLKARNSACPVVVIDDPVSSFDSIYKNKVVYAIIKILHHKKRIVLTHNTELLRLLESQYCDCFKLYLLNNTDGEENGFIALHDKEQGMLISLEKLLSTFRDAIFPHIQNNELFLISVVPFMRGYANITNNKDVYSKLTQLMHGYMTAKVDVAKSYKTLFGSDGGVLPDSYEVSVTDILAKTDDDLHILDPQEYPLLDKTLRHSFTYLYLRLAVENALVEKFSIDTNRNKQLGQIISAAYPPDEIDNVQVQNRIRLTSKKTLINEFNHFEGNLSIFQPAIDITDQSLKKEYDDIMTFIKSL